MKDAVGFDDLTAEEQKRIRPKIEAAAREAIRDHGKEETIGSKDKSSPSGLSARKDQGVTAHSGA